MRATPRWAWRTAIPTAAIPTAASRPVEEVDRQGPAAAEAGRLPADRCAAARKPADPRRAACWGPGAADPARDRPEPGPALVRATPEHSTPEPAKAVPAVQAVAAKAGVPEPVGPGRSAQPEPDVPEGEHHPAGQVRGRLRAQDERPAAAGCPGELPRAARDARAARPARDPGCPGHRWGRACYQAGWECSLTTPSLHRLRCPEHPVRSRRRCARSRAMCRLHRDSSTARPWSVGRLSEPAWQRSELRHHST